MRYNTIIVRYSELFLKSEFVRNQMQKKLSENIKNGIKKNGIEAEVTRERGRIFVKTEQIKEASRLLGHIFGVFSFSPAIRLELGELEGFVKENMDDLVKGKTFAVRCSRTGKHDFTSKELAARIGEIVFKGTSKKVDLSHPESELFIEVKDQEAYVFTEKTSGPGGMPFGSQGKVSCLVDSHESLVACWLMMKRGCVPVVYYTAAKGSQSADVLDKWSYGNTIKKVGVKGLDDIGDTLPLVVGHNLEKNGLTGLKEYQKRFKVVLAPVIAFKKEEIGDFWEKINK